MAEDSARHPLPLVLPWNAFYWRSGAARGAAGAAVLGVRRPPVPARAHGARRACRKRSRWSRSSGTRRRSRRSRSTTRPGTRRSRRPTSSRSSRSPRTRRCASRPTSSAARRTTVHIGMPVRVVFEARDDVWVPLFEPDPDAPSARRRSPSRMVPSRDRQNPPAPIPAIGAPAQVRVRCRHQRHRHVARSGAGSASTRSG